MLAIFHTTSYSERLAWKDGAALCSVAVSGEKPELLVQDSVRTQMSPTALFLLSSLY